MLDRETGEIATGYEIKRIRRLSDAQREAKKADSLLEQVTIDNGGYVFALFKSDLIHIGDGDNALTSADMARLLYLGTYIGWSDGKLRSDNGKVVYTKKHLSQLLGLSRNKAHDLYVKLIATGVLLEDEQGALYISPRYFYRGKDIIKKIHEEDVRYTRVFIETVRQLYQVYGKSKSASRLGVLYRILPYINFAYNIVCHNPRESDFEKLQAIPVSDLATILGYAQVRELTNTITILKTTTGQPLFCYFGSSRNRQGLIVNPYTIYAGNANTLKLAEDIFKIARSIRQKKAI